MKQRPKEKFVFRFDIYDGSEDSNDIYKTDVVQYEFVNQGTTICVLNDGLLLYPQFVSIEPVRVKLDIWEQETDVNTYKYRFQEIDYTSVYDNSGDAIFPFIKPFVASRTIFNRLLVISKVKIQHK